MKPSSHRSLSLALWLSFLALPVWAADDESKAAGEAKADPKAHALIDKLIEATGGEEAISKIKSRVVEAEMAMPAMGISINMKMSQKSPNLVYVEQNVPGLMDAKQGFDGTTGWSEDTLLGYRELKGGELEQLKRESNLHRELKLKEEFPGMKMLPDVEADGKKLHVIEATSEDNRKETWFIDAETHLLHQMDQKMNMGAQGELDVTIVLKDYEEFDGVKLPTTSEIKNPAFSATLKFKNVKHNVELFASPKKAKPAEKADE